MKLRGVLGWCVLFGWSAIASAAPPHRVASPLVPDATFEVGASLRALPPLRFPIGDSTDADRRLFVASDGDTLQRMVVVQFEQVQPGSTFRFVFPSVPPRQFGTHTYRAGTYAYDDVEAAARAPGLEADRTRAALAAAGLRPPRYWHVARLARVADAQGKGEVIVFYMENADARYPAGLVNVDEDGDGLLEAADTQGLWQALEQAVHAGPGGR